MVKYKDYQIKRLLGSPFGRLWKKGIGCIVVSTSETYFKQIYDTVKTHKKSQNKWSDKCERDYNKLMAEWERNSLSINIGDSIRTKHGIGKVVSITREWIIQDVDNHEYIISIVDDHFEHFVTEKKTRVRKAKNSENSSDKPKNSTVSSDQGTL